MKIKIPVAKLVGLLAKLINYAKGGISKEEAAELAAELLLIAGSLLEDELVVNLKSKE